VKFVTRQPTKPTILCTQKPAQANEFIHVVRMVFMCARPFRAEGWPMLTDAIASAASGAGKSGDSYIRFHCYNVPQIDLPVKRFFQNVVHIRDSRTPQKPPFKLSFGSRKQAIQASAIVAL
jgi:hypothetical protein